MTQDCQHRRRYRYGQRHDQRIKTEQLLEALHHQHHVDDVETGEHKQRRQQRQNHPAIAELGPRLDHLRQAQMRPLGAVKGHEQGAEHNTQRTGQDGP